MLFPRLLFCLEYLLSVVHNNIRNCRISTLEHLHGTIKDYFLKDLLKERSLRIIPLQSFLLSTIMKEGFNKLTSHTGCVSTNSMIK